MIIRTCGLPIALVLLAGCSQEVPSRLPEAGTPDEASASPVKAASLQVQPETVALCKGKAGAKIATVKWNAEGVRPSGVAIYVIGRDGNSKLWLKGGATGQSNTGPWVRAGTRFILQEAASGRQLAEALVLGAACE